MKNWFFLLVSLLFIGSVTAQKKVENEAYNVMLKGLLSHTVNEVSALEAAIEENVVFLDSRELNEYKVSHIENSIWVGYDTLQMDSVLTIPKNSKIIVYCSVGARSENVSEKLLENGFTDVSNMYGGLFEWVNQGLPVYNNEGETQRIHAYDKVWGVWVNEGDKVYNK